MYPVPWFFSPNVHLPFSGDLAQNIAPATNWFSEHIRGEAGDPAIESQAFDVASYGKQLGLITEVLLAMHDDSPVTPDKARQSRAALQKIWLGIEVVKARAGVASAAAVEEQLAQLRLSSPDDYARIVGRLRNG